MSGKPIVALDMGTTKICVIVAEGRGQEVAIEGFSIYPSHGLRKGVVVDMDETVSSISQAVKKAESNYDGKISSVYVGIAGSHIESFNHRGSISIENKIYAGDQIAQIERYCNYNKDKNKVFYLNLFGEEPHPDSKGKLKSETDFKIISYQT